MSKKSTKRIWSVMLACTMSASLLAGCGGGNNGTSGTGSVGNTDSAQSGGGVIALHRS